MRRAARRDENEPAVIAELQSLGARVQPLSARGVPDLLVYYRGVLLLIEVIGAAKAAKYRATAGLTPDQVLWQAAWPGRVYLVRDPQQAALALVEATHDSGGGVAPLPTGAAR